MLLLTTRRKALAIRGERKVFEVELVVLGLPVLALNTAAFILDAGNHVT